MRFPAFVFLVLALTGCERNADIRLSAGSVGEIEEKCASIEQGMAVSDSDRIMRDVGKTLVENTSGENTGTGYVLYWNSPADSEVLKNDPMRVVVPHGETCKVKFDVDKQISDVVYEYVNEAEYQYNLSRSE